MSDEWQEDPPMPPKHAERTFRSTAGRSRGRGRGFAGESSNSNWRARGNNNDFRPGEKRGVNRSQRGDGRATGFTYYNRRDSNVGSKKVISVPSKMVGRIIGKGGSKIRDLQSESKARIEIGQSQNGFDTNITLIGSAEAIATAEGLIDDLIENKPPPPSQPSDASTSSGSGDVASASNPSEPEDWLKSGNFLMINENGHEVVNWPKLNAFYDEQQNERYASLPPIVKDFYKEDPEVARMNPADVAAWRKANNDIQVKRTFDEKLHERPIPNPVHTFEQAFQQFPEILQEIYKQDFKEPSPIQCQAWPILLRGDDMIGIAQTGTGKTLAFLLPALIHIDGQIIPREEREGPTVLIMAPTRELALQIEKEVLKYQYKDLKSVCLYGGGNRKEQIEVLEKGVDIVIATPGRLIDLIKAKHLNAINFSYIVLDEADRMLDMGFEPQIRVSLFDVRPDRQTIMTSATWPPGVRRLAQSYMNDPIQVNVGSLDLATVHSVTQQLVFVEEDDKDATLFEFLDNMGPNDKVIIFCGKKSTASHITSSLACKGVRCQALHGDRDQDDREAAMDDMVSGAVNILVATDVASRGIDIKDLTHVVNLDFPRHIEDYVHRVGRTGRAGRTGIALSYISKYDWAHARDLMNILQEANQEIPQELVDMANRFDAMKLRKEKDGGDGKGGRGRGGRGGRGGRDRW